MNKYSIYLWQPNAISCDNFLVQIGVSRGLPHAMGPLQAPEEQPADGPPRPDGKRQKVQPAMDKCHDDLTGNSPWESLVWIGKSSLNIWPNSSGE